jgi:hypothetical protein
MSIQDIQANPQDTSNFYLASIHQALTGSNLSHISLPSSPPTFTPPTYGIWINSLWFLSLVISITCAVLANLLQQWARKYINVTQPRFTANEPRRARYRAFYAEGVENFLLPWVFDALPAMLHLSVFLFFAGLVVFLWNFDPTISKLILSWVVGCVTLYGYITFIPIFRHDCPYNTPLSPLAWSIVTGVLYISLRVFKWISYLLNIIFQIFSCIRWSFLCLFCPFLCCLFCCFDDLPDFLFASAGIDLNRLAEAGDRHRKLFFQGMQKTAEKAALGLQSGLSKRAFMWTFDSSHEDKELECFFSNLPGFRKSNGDEDFLDGLTGDQKENLWSGLVGWLDRTFSSDSLLEDDKTRRAKICADALQVDPLAILYILDSVISEDQCAPVQSAEVAHFFGRLDNGKDIGTPMLTQAIVSSVVATAVHNDEWFTIAYEELGVEESVLRNYMAPDLSLAILIHATCQQLNHYSDPSWPSNKFSKVLRAASKFKVQQASPELQSGFCALWNHIVDNPPGDIRKVARFILRPIYKVYVDIHQRSRPTAGLRFSAHTHARPSEVADMLRSSHMHLPCTNETHWNMRNLSQRNNDDTTLITFALIAVLAHPTAVTTAPGASPAMSSANEPAATEDDGKSKPDLLKEIGDLYTPSANRAHASMPDPQSSLLSATDSKGVDVGGSPEPNIEGTGGAGNLPVSPCGDDIV